jgi:hypothetical protein
MTEDTHTKVPRLAPADWYTAVLFLGAVAAVWSGIAWALMDLFLLQ